MDTSIDNNQFEVKPIKRKQKIIAPNPNVYLNPALDLLANDDPMCNNAMEIIPVKKRKRTRSCEIVAFENSALDVGITKQAVNEFLKRELENVRKNIKPFTSADPIGPSGISNEEFSFSDSVSRREKLSLPLENNEQIYDIVGIPTADDFSKYTAPGTMENPGNNQNFLTDDFSKYTAASTSGNSVKNNNLQYKVMEEPSTRTKVKVVAVVEPRMNVSEPIYANLTELSMPPQINKPVSHISENNMQIDVLPENNINSIPSNFGQNPVQFQQNVNFIPLTLNSTENMPSFTSHNFTDIIDTQSGLEVSNIEDINVTEIDSNTNYKVVPEFGKDIDLSAINKTGNIQTNITNQVFINNNSNVNLSFIDRLALDSPITNQSLCFDDDLNESNIMEIKTITIITKTKRVAIPEKKIITNPFLDPNLTEELNNDSENPFLIPEDTNAKFELEYNDEVINRPVPNQAQIHIQSNNLMPRRLFDNNSTVCTMNESSIHTEQNEYENIDGYRSESPVYENIGESGDDSLKPNYEKQSRILGCDVSRFSAYDIMNINRNKSNSSNESNDSKKDLKHQIMKAGNKLSKKVFKTLKKTFKHDKTELNTTSNPYEVPRKVPKKKIVKNESGIENPALKLDISDDTEDDEIEDEEHQYETVKTLRNTRLNMNVTPLKERYDENIDTPNKTGTPSKKVRFDSTLNQEKVITGNSFDYGIQSPGFDAKIDKFHDELENCINEKKFLQQNM